MRRRITRSVFGLRPGRRTGSGERLEGRPADELEGGLSPASSGAVASPPRGSPSSSTHACHGSRGRPRGAPRQRSAERPRRASSQQSPRDRGRQVRPTAFDAASAAHARRSASFLRSTATAPSRSAPMGTEACATRLQIRANVSTRRSRSATRAATTTMTASASLPASPASTAMAFARRRAVWRAPTSAPDIANLDEAQRRQFPDESVQVSPGALWLDFVLRDDHRKDLPESPFLSDQTPDSCSDGIQPEDAFRAEIENQRLCRSETRDGPRGLPERTLWRERHSRLHLTVIISNPVVDFPRGLDGWFIGVSRPGRAARRPHRSAFRYVPTISAPARTCPSIAFPRATFLGSRGRLADQGN